MTVAERLHYIPGFTEGYATEIGAIRRGGERLAERVERERGKLTRPDGTPVYAPAEMQERQAAIAEAAGARFDQVAARYLQQAETEAADIGRRLTLLEGAEPLDSLSAEDQAKAAGRREFVREDVTSLASDALARRVRAVVAAGDKVEAALLAHYLPDRDGGRTTALREATGELEAFLGSPERAVKRRELEAKLRAAQALTIAVSSARRTVDGSDARTLAAARPRVGTMFR